MVSLFPTTSSNSRAFIPLDSQRSLEQCDNENGKNRKINIKDCKLIQFEHIIFIT